jgi:hypothetical protein
MPKSLRIAAGCRAGIVGGPQLISLEHALFDESAGNPDHRKVLRFDVMDVEESTEGQVLSLIEPLSVYLLKVFVVGVLRTNSLGEPSTEWVIWANDCDKGRNLLIRYSTQTRLGCVKLVERLPSFGI